MKNLENAISDVFADLGLNWTYMIEPNNIVTFIVPNSTKFMKVEFDINEDNDSVVGQVLERNGVTRQEMEKLLDKLMEMFDDPQE